MLNVLGVGSQRDPMNTCLVVALDVAKKREHTWQRVIAKRTVAVEAQHCVEIRHVSEIKPAGFSQVAFGQSAEDRDGGIP